MLRNEDSNMNYFKKYFISHTTALLRNVSILHKSNAKAMRYLFSLSTFTIFLLLGGVAIAQKVAVEEAKVVARSFAKMNSLILSRVEVESVVTGKEKTLETYHVVNFSQGGFAVVAANKAAYPVLAYSKIGHYPSGKDDSFIDSLLKGQSKSIAALNELKITANNISKKEWNNLALFAQGKVLRTSATDQIASTGQRASVPPLLTTTRSSSWGNLGSNDDYFIPYGDGNLTCVPVAMAQLMKYYKYPRVGIGTKSYTLYNKQTFRDCTLVGNFSKTIFNYDQMCFRLDSIYLNPNGTWLRTDPIFGVTENNKREIGKLVYNAGIAVDMHWAGIVPNGEAGTYLGSVNPSKWADSLIKYFRYSKVSDYMNHNTDPDICKTKLRAELIAGRPILFNYYPEGHAVLIDGYENNNYFHVVNGGDGLGDIYYRLYNIDNDGVHPIPRVNGFEFYAAFVQPNCGSLPTSINQQNVTLAAGDVQLYQTTGTATFGGTGTFTLGANSGSVEGAKAVIVAANSITFKAGFKSTTGSTLIAKIEGCGAPISYPPLRMKRVDEIQSAAISMIDSTKKWTSEKTGEHFTVISSYNFKIKEDSTVDNTTYGKIISNSFYNDSKYFFFGFCYEKQGRFYVIRNAFRKTIPGTVGDLIYDFNAKPKDTLQTKFFMADSAYFKGVVDSTTTVFFSGKSRKIVYFSPKFYHYKDPESNIMTKWRVILKDFDANQVWVEGIGDIKQGLLNAGIGVPQILTGPTRYGYPIVCLENTIELIYQNKFYPTCDFKNLGIPTLALESKNDLSAALSVYPNPTTATLGIQTSLNIARLVVYQSNGTKVLESKATESLDVSGLAAGLYLLEAWDIEGRRVVKKIEKR